MMGSQDEAKIIVFSRKDKPLADLTFGDALAVQDGYAGVLQSVMRCQ